MEHEYMNREISYTRDYASHLEGKNYYDTNAPTNPASALNDPIGNASKIQSNNTSALRAVVSLASNVAGALGINFGAANHDHQNGMKKMWDSGDHAGAVQYFYSWVDGVAKGQSDHIYNMLALRKELLDKKDPSLIPAYNAYLKSWLEGVGSPIPLELLAAYTYDRYSKDAPDFLQWIDKKGLGTPVPRTPEAIALYSTLNYLNDPGSSNSPITTGSNGTITPVIDKPNKAGFSPILMIGIVLVIGGFIFLNKK